jgi:hypothetical protein
MVISAADDRFLFLLDLSKDLEILLGLLLDHHRLDRLQLFHVKLLHVMDAVFLVKTLL